MKICVDDIPGLTEAALRFTASLQAVDILGKPGDEDGKSN